MKFFLVRHGQDEDNANNIINGWRDKPLTELGCAQAREAAAKLRATGATEIFSSPLKRAMKTAEIIADDLGVHEIKVLESLKERNFGSLSGHTEEEAKKMCNKLVHIKEYYCIIEADGIEPYPELFKRAKAAISKIKKSAKTQNVIIVCHGAMGKMIEAVFKGKSWRWILNDHQLANCEIWELKESPLAKIKNFFSSFSK